VTAAKQVGAGEMLILTAIGLGPMNPALQIRIMEVKEMERKGVAALLVAIAAES